MGWPKGLLRINQKTAEAPSTDGMQAQNVTMLAETDHILHESANTMPEFNSYTPEEQAWLEWFTGLPEEHKEIVERCGEEGVRATPENFDDILTALPNASA